ncbi:NAD/NADP-dependent betaine aldehyde dehydrogenase [Frankia canadensis]|uniref:NAD/NADP-dependent betaine aldehyde dehydrogenase n=1 Tax=Frankia canadensis TaxID=1836972 RepID=A0A2I2KHZ5_9ACTN|nr:aldehyde dehydrogenase family protein [Frankia canadensis]SNQ45286.1 NAD/NADP-dependent betaine aldehyde dehydrogenase [Frankia canadensis]SOU52576.1 NAD/NADP-dependent betaine aldehyde dehydrogenase [Frankia canadensis]
MRNVEDHSALAVKVLPDIGLYIGGEVVSTGAGGTLERVDPTTGQKLAEFPVAGSPEVDRAVRAARLAFPAWRRSPADRRRAILGQVAATLREHESELKQISALETGTPLATSRLAQAIDYFEYYAGWCDKFAGELVATYPREALDYVRYEPYGVIGALVTWNGPVINAAMKLAPALAAGNTVVLKSPELGPFALMRFAQLLTEAGIPDGVVNIITGDADTAKAIIRHPDVAKVSFTGGPGTARKVMGLAAESLTPVCLELGGKSANLVFEDADLDRASQMAALMSTVLGAGQGCLFPTRLLVQESVYEDVIGRVKAVAEGARMGDPLDPETVMGPVISAAAVRRIGTYVDEARQTARVVAGADAVADRLPAGNFVAPTVFADVANDSRLAREEVFGPVLAVTPFATEDEAVALANDSSYGLAGYVHTRDLIRAHRVADRLDAGYISVNAFPQMSASAPFGGTKASGFGREGGRAGIEEFVHHKNIQIALE